MSQTPAKPCFQESSVRVAERRLPSGRLDGTGIALRPHFKAHKSTDLARWQMARSGGTTLGFCAQTIRETECLVREGGCRDVLLTNSAAPASLALRLARLKCEHPDVALAALVDCPQHVENLAKAAREADCTLGAFIEIECGQDRGGCAAGSDVALALAEAIVKDSALEWGGLHVYHGSIQHVPTGEARQQAVDAGPAAAARTTVDRLAAAGIPVPKVTGGGTGTLLQDLRAGTHSEVQPGSYLIMDRQYSGIENAEFAQSLFLHTTVTSANLEGGKRILDCGSKAVDLVGGLPQPTSLIEPALATALEGVTYESGGDEHGILRNVPEHLLPVGSTLQLVPAHCDPTVSLHDFMVGVRDGTVEHVWRVDARGW